MSFKCEKCGEIGDKPVRVVVETAPIVHADGGAGTKIVREELRHPECAAVEATVRPSAESVENRPRLVVDNTKE
jgi:hypothetical protein